MAAAGLDVVGKAGGGVMPAASAQSFHHAGTDFPVQQLDHVFSAHGVTQRQALTLERIAERVQRKLAAFEARPCVSVRVQAVYAPQEVTRESPRLLEFRESHKRAFGEDAAKIPKDRLVQRIRARCA